MGIRTSTIDEGIVQIVIDGSMTIYDAAALRHDLLAVLDQAPTLEVDLADVDEMDTAGLQLLLMAWNEAARTGRSIRLLGTSEAVTEVLDRYRLWSFLGANAPAAVPGE